MQVNFDNRQSFGHLYIDKFASPVLMERTRNPLTYLKIESMRQIIEESPLTFNVTAGHGVASKNRLQAFIYDKNGKLLRHINEKYLYVFFNKSPKSFFKKLLKIHYENK